MQFQSPFSNLIGFFSWVSIPQPFSSCGECFSLTNQVYASTCSCIHTSKGVQIHVDKYSPEIPLSARRNAADRRFGRGTCGVPLSVCQTCFFQKRLHLLTRQKRLNCKSPHVNLCTWGELYCRLTLNLRRGGHTCKKGGTHFFFTDCSHVGYQMKVLFEVDVNSIASPAEERRARV